MKPPPHPMQPIVIDENGRMRFRANAIVRYLVDNGELDINKLSVLPVDDEDKAQFWALLGYSVGAWGSLSFVDEKLALAADTAAEQVQADTPAAPTPSVVPIVLMPASDLARIADGVERIADLLEGVVSKGGGYIDVRVEKKE